MSIEVYPVGYQQIQNVGTISEDSLFYKIHATMATSHSVLSQFKSKLRNDKSYNQLPIIKAASKDRTRLSQK